jgi:CBS domain-containing protein
MRVSVILATKGSTVATVDPSVTVAEVVDQLRLRGVGALVVSRNGIHIDGLITERDVVRRLAEQGDRTLRLTAEEVMTVNNQTCSPTDAIDYVMEIMTNHRVRHLPVLVEGTLAGIVSIGDVVKLRLIELEEQTRQLSDYITTGR